MGKFKLTEFQKKVLKEVLKVPLGETITYKELAKRIGNPKAVRAVGKALKENPFPLIIPCHRIVKSSGDIGGYSRGRGLKKKLLDLEKELKGFLSS